MRVPSSPHCSTLLTACLRKLLVVACALVALPSGASAAITEPTWQMDSVYAQAQSPRPFPTGPAALFELSTGGYMAGFVFPLPFGIAEFASDGTPVGPFMGMGNPEFGLDGLFGTLAGVEASDGKIWLTDTSLHRVERRSRSGVLELALDTVGTGTGEFAQPAGISQAPDGTILVVDTGNNRVQRLSSSGAHLATYGTPGADAGEFAGPMFIAVASNGSFYVTDSGNNRVQQLAADGTFIREWGTAGSALGELNSPMGIAIANNGDILVADSDNDRIQRFSPTGTAISSFGTVGTALGEFNAPLGIVQLPNDQIVVTDYENFRVAVFADDGTPIENRGELSSGTFRAPLTLSTNGTAIVASGYAIDSSGLALYPYRCSELSGCEDHPLGSLGSGPGQYRSSAQIGIGTDGSYWVADLWDNDINHYAADGTFINTISSFGTDPGQVSAPSALLFDRRDNTLWVADSGNQRIQHLQSDGSFISETPTGITGQVFALQPLSDGSLLVGGFEERSLKRIQPDGTVMWSRTLNMFGPSAVLDLGDGTALVGAMSSKALQVDLASGSTIREVTIPSETLPGIVSGLAKLDDGRIIASDPANNRLVVISLHQPPPLTVQPQATVPQAPSGSGTINFTGGGGAGSGYTFAGSWQGSTVQISSNGSLDLSSLAEGRGVLRVVIRDPNGGSAAWEQAIVIDRTAPRFRTSNTRFTVRTTKTLAIEDALSTATSTSVTLKVPKIGSNLLRATVRDSVGNEAVRTFRVIRRPSLSSGPLNDGVVLWRPGSTFNPDGDALRDVFGNGSRNATAGAGGRARSPYAPALVREVQFRLKQTGHLSIVYRSSGSLDRSTRSALKRYQRARGLKATGLPDKGTRVSLDNTLESSLGLKRM